MSSKPSRRSTRRTVTQDTVREWALALPETVQAEHMGRPDFRVRNKIFATLPPDGQSANVKCSPASLDALVRLDPATYRDAWGGRWVGVSLATVTARDLRELLTDAWRLVAPAPLIRDFDSR